ncbi:hypothetical protein TRIATDRAFT_88217 [Trichoderma atroviride IMI 206040]|uniref:Uncharacterized protein n=1 Tax=Hypocrea atroviridis (strain ATCC 20476 / IMI 206040) TaxID=452589 RepID=G9NV43_HYPAI|nr:uncharacterized protein TRIATDRAFT_88217 [Trichoderma atroviride IMI 206040]EHK44866.1 hypothetical protein TRIATDRAFT_88217 [Trichoderma atroviride IMI 206040]
MGNRGTRRFGGTISCPSARKIRTHDKHARITRISSLSSTPVGNLERIAPPRPTGKSLIDLCIARLPYLFQSTENITDHEVLELPHIKPLIWEYCLENAHKLSICPALLAQAFKGQTHISFAQFSKLAPAAVRHVLRLCPKALSINLSGTAAMADDEIEETLAAIDHSLDALYLLTPPHEIVGTMPKEVMRALRNWTHRCSKVLISSVLAEGSRGPIPISLLSPGTWGSPTVGSDKFYEVHSIPVEASFAVYNHEPKESIYSNPGYHMCNLTPDAWTAVVLRDVVHQDPPPQDKLGRPNFTDRFRILLLRPRQVIIVGESQSISVVSFRIRTYSSSSNPGPSEAAQVLTCDQRRTVIQFQNAPQDVADAISAVQMVLNAAAAVRNVRERIERTCLNAQS